ncbi:MAG: hypothetical protein V4687_04330 [Bacteroidota bacterium]
MITPENQIPLDDSNDSENDDQQSQKDIHSNGFEETSVPSEDDNDNSGDIERMEHATKASEPSFTLNLGDDQPSEQ